MMRDNNNIVLVGRYSCDDDIGCSSSRLRRAPRDSLFRFASRTIQDIAYPAVKRQNNNNIVRRII